MEPRVRRQRSPDEEEEAPAPEMLRVDGEAGGSRWVRELEGGEERGEEEEEATSAKRPDKKPSPFYEIRFLVI